MWYKLIEVLRKGGIKKEEKKLRSKKMKSKK